MGDALIIESSRLYGRMPSVSPKPVRTSRRLEEMLRFDLEHENRTIETTDAVSNSVTALGEFATAEHS